MSVETLFKNAASKTILAPMAGYTDFAFRNICSEFGAGLTVTEMISSKALVMGNELSRKMLYRLKGEKSAFCQIFGHEPEVMSDSVKIDEVAAFDGVDINMGCPVRKIVKSGDGSALLENHSLASKCITAVKLALKDKPLSVKFRLGISDDSVAVNFAKMCRDSGADFITVHFRTRNQMYSGIADYTLLEDIANCGLPVFANGDIVARQQYEVMLNRGAFGVSIGRGAVGKPYVFSRIAGLPYVMDLLYVINKHADALLTVFEDRVVCNELKKHVSAYLKGMRNAKSVIVAANASKTTESLINLVSDFVADNPDYGIVGSETAI